MVSRLTDDATYRLRTESLTRRSAQDLGAKGPDRLLTNNHDNRVKCTDRNAKT